MACSRDLAHSRRRDMEDSKGILERRFGWGSHWAFDKAEELNGSHREP